MEEGYMKTLMWAGAVAAAAIAPEAGTAAQSAPQQTEQEAAAEPLIDASLDVPDALQPLIDPNIPLGGATFA